jgi:nucleoid DNA-binding protein
MAEKKTAKKEAGKKEVAKKAPANKLAVVKKPMTKALMIAEIAETTGLNKKQVNSVLDELTSIIDRHIKKRAPGKFILPGLIKVQVKTKPATKARKGVNPFTGEETMFKAKPARRVVKVTPLKKLKEMAE